MKVWIYEKEDVRKPVFTQDGTIDCEINHPTMGWIPFTAYKDDEEPHGPAIYEICMEMKPKKYKAPKLTPDNFPLARWQFHAMLEVLGKTGDVASAIDGIPDAIDRAVARAKLNNADVFTRDDPLIAVLAPMIGLDDTTIDDAWMQAKDMV